MKHFGVFVIRWEENEEYTALVKEYPLSASFRNYDKDVANTKGNHFKKKNLVSCDKALDEPAKYIEKIILQKQPLVFLKEMKWIGTMQHYPANTTCIGSLINKAHDFKGAVLAITQHKKALETLLLNEARLSVLLELSQMADAPLNEITSFALEEAIRLTGSEVGYLAFANEDETVLRMYAWSMNTIKGCSVKHKQASYKVDEMGLWGEALRQKKTIITNDYIAPDPLKKGQPEGHI